MRRSLAVATLALTAALVTAPGGAALAQEQSSPAQTDMSDAEREALRIEIRAYLLEHPEVLMEAIQILEARRNADALNADAELVAAHREQLFNDPNSWVGGNPDGDVTLVEFLDHRCGYCKRAHPELEELLERDPNVRLVVKEFPILGPDSVAAGRMATAANMIDPAKYGDLNDALMTYNGQLNEAAAYRVAASIGYDIAELKRVAASAEVEAQIQDNYELAKALGVRGTPSFVLGDRIIRGYLPVDDMLAAVAEARATLE
jgi:protein-disulfide isomerase